MSDPVFWKLPAVMWPWALLVMLVVALGEAIKSRRLILTGFRPSATGGPRNISISKTCPAAGCDLIGSNKPRPNRAPRGSPAKSGPTCVVRCAC